ncbi:hypothetical protein Mapa_010337 [Marchantia paleacea]|nr:hypothetical protein Mapa_010337 [Marchantia paleacea]
MCHTCRTVVVVVVVQFRTHQRCKEDPSSKVSCQERYAGFNHVTVVVYPIPPRMEVEESWRGVLRSTAFSLCHSIIHIYDSGSENLDPLNPSNYRMDCIVCFSWHSSSKGGCTYTKSISISFLET